MIRGERFNRPEGESVLVTFSIFLFSALSLLLVSQGQFYLFLAPVIIFFACWKRFSFVIGPVLILFFLAFKNLVYHFSYVFLPDYFRFDILPILFGYDYLLMLVFGGVGLLLVFSNMNYRQYGYLLFVAVYIFYGLYCIDLISVAAYSRFYLVPVFAFVLGWLFYLYGSERYVYAFLSILFLYVIAEFLPGFYELIDVNKYLELKYYGRDITSVDYVHKMGMSIGDDRINRFLGPQFHPISIGYMLLFLHVALYALKPILFYILSPFFWFMLFLSSKGALTADLIILALLFNIDFLTGRRFLSGLLLLLYISSLLVISSIPGLTSGYEHLQGLIGGFNNMFANPLGAGIGVGGTMSSLKGVGHGGESGLGVILTHMGLLGLIVYLYVIRFLFQYLFVKDRRLRAYGVYCLVVLLNGMLQEEAFLPSAVFLGWFMFAFSLRRLKVKTMNYHCEYVSK